MLTLTLSVTVSAFTLWYQSDLQCGCTWTVDGQSH